MSPFQSFRWLIPAQGHSQGQLFLWEGEAGLCELLWASLSFDPGETQGL